MKPMARTRCWKCYCLGFEFTIVFPTWTGINTLMGHGRIEDDRRAGVRDAVLSGDSGAGIAERPEG